MTKLSNVKGRITYISSYAKQENLYAVYETTERKFWRELAKCNQEEFVKSGTEGKCIEARELIIALPESFTEFQPDRLLQLFTNHFKQNYGTECIAALHHNKRKTNYHIHLIFAERKLLDEPIIKIASRNMFYDENGKHVRTKKEILGEDGEIQEGCSIVKKGEVYEKKLFTAKDERFKCNSFLDEVKHSYTDLINIYVQDEKQKLQVFERGSVYLATKKIGKNKFLEGAEFTLYTDSKTTNVAKDYLENDLTGTTGKNGELVFDNIITGTEETPITYYLKEVKTKAGYVLLKEPIKITLPYKYNAGDIVNGNKVTESGVTWNLTYTIINDKAFDLPASGNKGIYKFIVIGITTVLVGGYLLTKRRKRRREQ